MSRPGYLDGGSRLYDRARICHRFVVGPIYQFDGVGQPSLRTFTRR